MSNVTRFANISPIVIGSLDRDFPGWPSLVPEEKDSELNEDSLITLLKSRKRGEIYRAISDQRKVMWNELYGNSEKSTADLIHEFAMFNYEQMNKLLDTENKLSAISLEFNAKAEAIDFDKMDENLNATAAAVGNNIDKAISDFNNNMDSHLESFVGRSVEGVPIKTDNELKKFLEKKTVQFKEENKRVGERQKRFINDSLKKLIQSKTEKMKSGELPKGAFNRSDVFTDEEVKDLQAAQEHVILESIKERKHSNINTMDEAAQQFLGVSGKEEIIKKIDELPENAVSPEIKQIIEDAFDRGGIFPDEKQAQTSRGKRAAIIGAKAASLLLDYASSKLEQLSKMSDEELKSGNFYQNCKRNRKKWWLWTFAPLTGAACEIHIALVEKGIAQNVYYYMAKTFSVVSYVISLWSAKNVVELFKEIGKSELSDACDNWQETAKDQATKNLATLCSSALFFHSAFEVINDPKSRTLDKVLSGAVAGMKAKDTVEELLTPPSSRPSQTS